MSCLNIVRGIRNGVALLLLGLGSTGCDPCAGIADCIDEPRVILGGRIVERIGGAPVSGARIDVVHADGVATERDSITVVTDAAGRFMAEMGRVGVARGETVLSVRVTTPAGQYRVQRLDVPVLRGRGEAHIMADWVDRPYFPYIGEFWKAHDPTERQAETLVEIRRTSGVAVSGPAWRSDDRLLARTNSRGQLPLFGRDVTAADMQPLVAVISTETTSGWRVLGTHRMWPTQLYNHPSAVTVFRGGPFFPYEGRTYIAGKPAHGVDVEFRRVSGPAGSPETFVEFTDTLGTFRLRHFSPVAEGEVIFDLTFTSSPSDGSPRIAPFTVRMTLPVRPQDSYGEAIGVFHVDRPENAFEPPAGASSP